MTRRHLTCCVCGDYDMREVVNGVMYVLRARLPMALHAEGPAAAQYGERLFLPVGLGRHIAEDPPDTLRQMPRTGRAEREASPTACVIDSQSVKSAEKGALPSTRTASMPAS